MSVVTMKALLESGVHFGHQTHKWNPKMDKYIFIKRNGIHILDLKQTLDAVNEAYMFLKEIVSKGETVLFVGTKKQAREAIENAAKKCGAFYICNRWYGGMLTNMQTIRRSIEKLNYYEQIVEDGTINSFTKLEAQKMKKIYDKINSALSGIRDLDKLPGAVFIVDTIKEKIVVNEARKLNIPIVAMVDTNSDPDLVDYIIPANDDAIRAIFLLTDIMANAVIEGKQILLEGAGIVQPEEEKKTEEEIITPEVTPEKEPKEEKPKAPLEKEIKKPEKKEKTEEEVKKPTTKKEIVKKVMPKEIKVEKKKTEKKIAKKEKSVKKKSEEKKKPERKAKEIKTTEKIKPEIKKKTPPKTKELKKANPSK